MANLELLEHELDRVGVITVVDAVMYADDAPVLKLDTLKISNMTSETSNKTIKGGQYADILAYYAYGRTISLEFQDALISWKSMKELWGAELSASTFNLHKVEKLTAENDSGIKVTLTYKPLMGDTDPLEFAAINRTTEADVTAAAITGLDENTGVITFATGVSAGDVVEVYYVYASDDAAIVDYTPTEMILKSTSFPRIVKFVGTSFVLEQNTGKRVAIEIEVPKLKLDGAFTLTMEAEGDASVFDFAGMALINADKELMKIKHIAYLD